MPIPWVGHILQQGIKSVPYMPTLLKTISCLTVIALLKLYFSGPSNSSERAMHSKIIMITGGTSGIGASVAHALAERGAQIILLTQQPPTDPFLVDYVDDMRSATNNELVYAEQVDLSSLHSIRVFATRWIDNTPPRRLDMVILCASTLTPRFSTSVSTLDGLEPCWGINYLANFHLLGLLSPALRAQPADRDVRVIVATCGSYATGDLKAMQDKKAPLPPGREFATSKLAMMVFVRAFQKHLDSWSRPDKAPPNARVVIVDPEPSRTPGMRRWLTGGSIWGLFFYVLLWPFWWLVLKSSNAGAQGFLKATLDADLGRGQGGRHFKGVQEVDTGKYTSNEQVASQLWKFSDQQITALEKEAALERAARKKKGEKQGDMDKQHSSQSKSREDGSIKESTSTGVARKEGSRRARKQ